MGRLYLIHFASFWPWACAYYPVYQLDEQVQEVKSCSLFSRDDLNTAVTDVDLGACDDKVLKGYTRRDGSLTTLPSHRKKLEAVLRHVVKSFKVKKFYSEKQMNEILPSFREDTATLGWK